MNEAVKLILSLSLSGSILAALILAIRPIIRHKLSKSIQYCIWIVVIMRLVLPFSFDTSIMNQVFYGNGMSAGKSSADSKNPVTAITDNTYNTDNSAVLSGVKKAGIKENDAAADFKGSAVDNAYISGTDWSRVFSDIFNQYAVYIWLAGAILALTVNLSGYIRFSRFIEQANKAASSDESKLLSALLQGRRNVRLVRNRFSTTPMLVGILNPCIIIPDIDFSEKQLRNILLHEITHLKHFDILIKWLTMIAASIHWFNPLMYLIKNEIGHACELACDEAVIKKLDASEKQAYGETLISVAAEYKYPAGVMQATMCEEKKSLRERLLAIMNHSKKSRPVIALSAALLVLFIFGAVYLGAGVGRNNADPPGLYISAENLKTKAALTGAYDWTDRGIHTSADSINPTALEYGDENIVSVTGGQQLVIGTQKIKSDRKYDFTLDKITVYKDGRPVKLGSVQPTFLNGCLYIQAPPDRGEYIYSLKLIFKDRGTVNYGFVVRVDMLTYYLSDISKNKTPYVGNASKVSAIAHSLPAPDRYFRQQYISMKTSAKPYGLTIYYEAAAKDKYEGEWPITEKDSVIEANSRINALVAFCMIDNLDTVTFAYRISQSDGKLEASKYDTSFTFQRALFEKKYGNLAKLGKNLDMLGDKISVEGAAVE